MCFRRLRADKMDIHCWKMRNDDGHCCYHAFTKDHQRSIKNDHLSELIFEPLISCKCWIFMWMLCCWSHACCLYMHIVGSKSHRGSKTSNFLRPGCPKFAVVDLWPLATSSLWKWRGSPNQTRIARKSCCNYRRTGSDVNSLSTTFFAEPMHAWTYIKTNMMHVFKYKVYSMHACL